MSKILMPETGEPVTMVDRVELELPDEGGAIASIIAGAMAGVKLVVGICALLIAFLGLVAVLNLILGGAGAGCQLGVNGLGGALGQDWSVQFDWSLEGLLGWVMYPFAVIMGVPPSDARLAGTMLGERLVATEIPSYVRLAGAMKEGAFNHPGRSPVVIAYALCGFAHVASLAIFVGGIAALVPERRKDLAAVGPRALLAATLACLMTGAVAGVFFDGGAGIL
ncbi:MAG: nucleoside transporter C-terminal domain-containing protein [Planctomycetota bacterium]